MNRLSVPVVVLGLLLAACPTALAAPPERVAVTGVSDLLGGQVGGEVVPDRGGNLHLRQAAFVGGFALQGTGVSIEGAQRVVLTGVLDETLSGPVAGRLTVTAVVNGQATTIWEGTIHGVLAGLSFIGRAVAHGAGPYTGQRLTLEYRERPATPTNPNPEVFALSGVLTRHD
jgi:hypothetical protein